MASQTTSKVLPIKEWAVQTEVSTLCFIKVKDVHIVATQYSFKGCQAPSKEHSQFEIFPD